MPCLAGVIMVITYNMINKKEMKKLYLVNRSDFIAMCATFAATIIMPDLDWAIYMGIAISIALYLKNTNKVPLKILVPLNNKGSGFIEKEIEYVHEKKDLLIIQLEGNLYFGSAYDLESKLDTLADKAKVFILRIKQVTTIDITSLEAIRVFIRNVKEQGGSIIICGVTSGLSQMIMNSGLVNDVGADNIFMSEDQIFASSAKALDKAKEILNIGAKESIYAGH